MGLDTKRGKELDEARAALASWRQVHGGRGRPIPPALWSSAADVAREVGVPEVARAMRLDARKLARLVDGEVAPATRCGSGHELTRKVPADPGGGSCGSRLCGRASKPIEPGAATAQIGEGHQAAGP